MPVLEAFLRSDGSVCPMERKRFAISGEGKDKRKKESADASNDQEEKKKNRKGKEGK